MSEPRFQPFTTGPTKARYLCLGIVGNDGMIKAAYLRQQRVRHPIYSANSMQYVQGMAARLDKASRGGWGGREQ